MKCELVEYNLIGYIENTLPPEVKSDIEEHLLQCSGCQTLLNNVQITYSLANGSSKLEVSPYFYSRLENKLQNKKTKRIYFQTLTPAMLRPVLAAAVIFIGIFAGFSIGKQIPISNNVTFEKQNEVLNSYASEYYLDGSGEESLDNLISNE